MTKQRNPKLYVGLATKHRTAPRKGIVKIIKTVLKEKQYKYIRKHVKQISIVKSISQGWEVKTGTWFALKDKVKIYDNESFDEATYDDVVRHEFAHGEFHYLLHYNKEAFYKFVKLAKAHDPVSTYVKAHEKRFRRITNRDSVSMYADEQHSELALILAKKLVNHRPFKKPSKALVAAYRELHFLEVETK